MDRSVSFGSFMGSESLVAAAGVGLQEAITWTTGHFHMGPLDW